MNIQRKIQNKIDITNSIGNSIKKRYIKKKKKMDLIITNPMFNMAVLQNSGLLSDVDIYLKKIK